MKLNKIIRKVAIIPIIGNPREIEENAAKSIENCKNSAKTLAKQLNYPENCCEYEIFDTHFGCDFTDRPMGEKPMFSLKDMLARASSYGAPAKYTYVIYGNLGKEGKEI